MTTKKTRSSTLHPGKKTVEHYPYLKSNKAGGRSQCPLFSDGRHRIAVSPSGVQTRCLCGASR